MESTTVKRPYIITITSKYTWWQRIKNYCWHIFKKPGLLMIFPDYDTLEIMLKAGKWLQNGDCIYRGIKYGKIKGGIPFNIILVQTRMNPWVCGQIYMTAKRGKLPDYRELTVYTNSLVKSGRDYQLLLENILQRPGPDRYDENTSTWRGRPIRMDACTSMYMPFVKGKFELLFYYYPASDINLARSLSKKINAGR